MMTCLVGCWLLWCSSQLEREPDGDRAPERHRHVIVVVAVDLFAYVAFGRPHRTIEKTKTKTWYLEKVIILWTEAHIRPVIIDEDMSL